MPLSAHLYANQCCKSREFNLAQLRNDLICRVKLTFDDFLIDSLSDLITQGITSFKKSKNNP